MEMQQDGSLKTAVQEALGTHLDTKAALQQRLKQLLDSSPVMLFMKVSDITITVPNDSDEQFEQAQMISKSALALFCYLWRQWPEFHPCCSSMDSSTQNMNTQEGPASRPACV